MLKLITMLATLLVAGTATAGTAMSANVNSGRAMLEQLVSQDLIGYGIELDFSSLSLSQVAQIEGVLSDPERKDNAPEVKSAVRVIVKEG